MLLSRTLAGRALLFVVSLGIAIPGILAIVRLVGTSRRQWAQVGGGREARSLARADPT